MVETIDIMTPYADDVLLSQVINSPQHFINSTG